MYMVTKWYIPTSDQLLISFISLIRLYHRYVPYIKMYVKPLRRLVKSFYKKTITNDWTLDLVKLFAGLNGCIASSIVLACFYPFKPRLLKTDWSTRILVGFLCNQYKIKDLSRQQHIYTKLANTYLNCQKIEHV